MKPALTPVECVDRLAECCQRLAALAALMDACSEPVEACQVRGIGILMTDEVFRLEELKNQLKTVQ